VMNERRGIGIGWRRGSIGQGKGVELMNGLLK
jgi:hypothetical protein